MSQKFWYILEIIVFILMFLVILGSPMICKSQTTQHGIEWDPNPPEENVTGYKIYLDTNYIATVTTGTIYMINNPVPPGCWTVTAFNALGLESDHSEKVCRNLPQKSSGIKMIEK